MALMLGSSAAYAIGLGELRGGALLGEMPKFRIDLLGADRQLLDPSCFRLVRPQDDDGLPWLKKATLSVVNGQPPVLEIRAVEMFTAPAVNIAVMVGCGQDVVREYTVLTMPRDARALASNSPLPQNQVVQSPESASSTRSVRAAESKKSPTPVALEPKLAVPLPAPVGIEAVPSNNANNAAVAAEKEKIRQMEATLGDLQQRATDLAQKIEETSKPTEGTPVVQSQQQAVVAPPVTPGEKAERPVLVDSPQSSGWSLWAAIVGGLLVATGLIIRKRFAWGASSGDQEFIVDPPRTNERPERGGAELAVKPGDMASAPKLNIREEVMPAGTPVAPAVVPTPEASMMSVAAASVDEHFEANPVMELAEIMLSFGRTKGAAQALQEYIDANPQEALKPWLRLMDVYRMGGMRHEFEKVARELNRNFNVQVQSWEETSESGVATVSTTKVDVVLDSNSAKIDTEITPEGIESMPTILEQVIQHWNTPDILPFLDRLLRDNRGGTRIGFALPVVADILFLMEVKEITNKMESETER